MKQHTLPNIHVVKPQTQPSEVSLQYLCQIVEAQGALIEHLTLRVNKLQQNGTNKDIQYGPIHGVDLL